MAKALGVEGWAFRDVEVVATGAAPRGAADGSGRGAGGRPRGVAVDDAHAHDRRRGGAGRMSLPDWLDPLYEAAEMRAADAWAIEEQGVPAST